MRWHHLCISLLTLITLVGGDRVLENLTSHNQVPVKQAHDFKPNPAFEELVDELQRKWPKNRSIRFVFHGHSVPAGYFKTPVIQRFDSYPMIFQQEMCQAFPTAVIDVAVTAIGGENSQAGEARFQADVMSLKPDVVFIDYSLNDRRIGLQAAKVSWRKMIQSCIAANKKVVLLTPTPDSNEDITDVDSRLAQHARQVRKLGEEFDVPVVDSYAAFQQAVEAGNDVKSYLSQSNHPNRKGHVIVSNLLVSMFADPKRKVKKEQ